MDLPDDIPVCATRQDCHLLLFHDIFELTSDFPGFAHEFRVQEMLHAPAVIVPEPLSAATSSKVTFGIKS